MCCRRRRGKNREEDGWRRFQHCKGRGIRYITAAPSSLVCSVRIDIHLKGDVVDSVVYTRGCNGNAKGIGALIRGMKVDEAISRLKGIDCAGRGTSCPDQLARVLEAAMKREPAVK